ncbi:MAG: tetratricopeptide repeat protein [Blastocatellia bacterium]
MRRCKIATHILSVAVLVTVTTFAQSSQLGTINFATSGSPQAQAHFLRGVAAMHSFWYEEALEAFKESTRADPAFAMGYWGEAMTYNHPIWLQQDAEPARRALAQIKDTTKLTSRERAFVEAARILYGEGDKLVRDLAYAAAMEKMYREHPDDLEVATFYSLSLLGTVRPGDKGFARQVKAGAVALEVYQKNPNHPGAAHFVIHAFDDPEHAILALPAAFRYAQIAPAASHARHMPSHIFLQLGMWAEAAASNETAWKVSDDWVKSKNLARSLRDYHSNHWLTYIYCQQGRFTSAEGRINFLRQTMKDHGRESVRWYDDTVAAFIVESQRWDLAAKLFEPSPAPSAGGDHSSHASHGAAPVANQKPAAAQTMVPNTRRGMSLPLFVRALAAASAGSPDAEKLLTEMRANRGQSNDAYGAKILEIRELEIVALIAASKKNFDEAITAMKRATQLEEEMSPPSGPPTLIKPSHELFGEILLGAGKPQEASKQFATALARQPNRARSLLGSARAAAQSGAKTTAVEIYTKLLGIWKQADANLPEMREAREFVGQASAR